MSAAIAPAVQPARRPLGEAEDDPGQPAEGQQRAGDIEAFGSALVARLGDVASADDEDGGGDRHVDEEDPAPRRDLHEPAADERADRGHDAAEPGPRADRGGPVVAVKAGFEYREAAGCDHRGADALQRARRDERAGVRRGRAEQ